MARVLRPARPLSAPQRWACRQVHTHRVCLHDCTCVSSYRPYGLWPMMRPEAVSGAARALRCRGWYE
eukprot:5019114-Prymnesium_polylepis.2